MSLSERIFATVASLPKSKQQEVLGFAEYLKSKKSRKWNNFSVAMARKDMENEDSNYLLTDLKEIF
jgi:hypothetical protein